MFWITCDTRRVRVHSLKEDTGISMGIGIVRTHESVQITQNKSIFKQSPGQLEL